MCVCGIVRPKVALACCDCIIGLVFPPACPGVRDCCLWACPTNANCCVRTCEVCHGDSALEGGQLVHVKTRDINIFMSCRVAC